MQHRKHKAETDQAPHWTERWRNAVPTSDTLATHPWLKPMAHHVLDPKLWRMHHESVGARCSDRYILGFCVACGANLGSCS